MHVIGLWIQLLPPGMTIVRVTGGLGKLGALSRGGLSGGPGDSPGNLDSFCLASCSCKERKQGDAAGALCPSGISPGRGSVEGEAGHGGSRGGGLGPLRADSLEAV